MCFCGLGERLGGRNKNCEPSTIGGVIQNRDYFPHPRDALLHWRMILRKQVRKGEDHCLSPLTPQNMPFKSEETHHCASCRNKERKHTISRNGKKPNMNTGYPLTFSSNVKMTSNPSFLGLLPNIAIAWSDSRLFRRRSFR
jgi:hypothetical protein